MSTKRILAITGAALAAAAATMPAAMAAGVGIRGEFSGPIDYQGCSPEEGTHVASGTWRVNVHATTGTARFVIDVDGVPHVAFTTKLERVPDSAATFEGTTQTGAGPLTVTVSGTEMTYRIAPYDFTPWGGPTCDSVTYFGTVAWP